jgi:hypothetical protein
VVSQLASPLRKADGPGISESINLRCSAFAFAAVTRDRSDFESSEGVESSNQRARWKANVIWSRSPILHRLTHAQALNSQCATTNTVPRRSTPPRHPAIAPTRRGRALGGRICAVKELHSMAVLLYCRARANLVNRANMPRWQASVSREVLE